MQIYSTSYLIRWINSIVPSPWYIFKYQKKTSQITSNVYTNLYWNTNMYLVYTTKLDMQIVKKHDHISDGIKPLAKL